MKKYLLTTILVSLCTFYLSAQSKQFFNRLGKKTTESNAYYYQVKTKEGYYKSYYISNDKLLFEGSITYVAPIAKDNKYSGTCKWYYKNGELKSVVNFNENGDKNGESVDYYESGKVWKKVVYKNGVIKNNRFKEFEEDGRFSNVFYDQFKNNVSDWAVYETDKSDARIADGVFHINSKNQRGTSRFLNFPSSNAYSFEFTIKGDENGNEYRRGMLFGFKDWDNYSYFLIKGDAIFIGSVFEGVNSYYIEGMYDESIIPDGDNKIKLLSMGGYNVFSVNAKVVYKRDRIKLLGSNFGFVVSGEGEIIVDDVTHKKIDSNGGVSDDEDLEVKASGSGIILSSNGYILTNHHVIDDANGLVIQIHQKGVKKSYNAEVVMVDQANDLAILKIDDKNFTGAGDVKYSLAKNTQDVGASVYTLGYPLALSGLGNEVKFVDGKISSKTGYENALNSYQTSVPVQPGNSGGPLFNTKGELVGVVNARIKGADNVSYVVKMNYIRPLIDVLSDNIKFNTVSKVANMSTQSQVKALKDLVVLIKVK